MSNRMVLLYTIIVSLLAPLLIIYFLVFLSRRKDFRPYFLERLGRVAGGGDAPLHNPDLVSSWDHKQPCIWVHAVSVGEAMAAIPLVRGIRARFSSSRVVFSTYTPTGRDVVKTRCPEVDQFFYFPLDVYPIVEQVIARIHPTIFLLVETDIWPVFLRSLARRRIPTILVNGRISARRLLARPFYLRVLNQFSYFCMQTDADGERMIGLGIDPGKVKVTGNMKFAQAASKEVKPFNLREELGLSDGARLLIAGSTHEGEEEEIIRCYQMLGASNPDLFLLVAPRHPHRFDRVEALFRARGFSCVRRSQGLRPSGRSVILLDTLGELSRAYAVGTFIFVGGSWVRRGGHNVMEPAAWGKPIFFGPYMDHYSTVAASLEREGAAIRVSNGAELAAHIQRLTRDDKQIREMGRRAAAFVAGHQGAVEKNLDVIEKVIQGSQDDRVR